MRLLSCIRWLIWGWGICFFLLFFFLLLFFFRDFLKWFGWLVGWIILILLFFRLLFKMFCNYLSCNCCCKFLLYFGRGICCLFLFNLFLFGYIKLLLVLFSLLEWFNCSIGMFCLFSCNICNLCFSLSMFRLFCFILEWDLFIEFVDFEINERNISNV